eukprot:3745097-Rhodomonas_salina.1
MAGMSGRGTKTRDPAPLDPHAVAASPSDIRLVVNPPVPMHEGFLQPFARENADAYNLKMIPGSSPDMFLPQDPREPPTKLVPRDVISRPEPRPILQVKSWASGPVPVLLLPLQNAALIFPCGFKASRGSAMPLPPC